MKRRVVITGLGVVSPIGSAVDDFLAALREGRSGIRPVTRFDTSCYSTQMGGEVDGDSLGLTPGVFRDYIYDMVREAVRQAAGEARLDELVQRDPWAVGVSMATSLGGTLSREYYHEQKHLKGEADPALLLNVPAPLVTGLTARLTGARGPSATLVTACAAGTNAVGLGFDLIRRGEVRAAVTGGVDPFFQVSFSGFHALRALTKHICHPFDAGRDGLVIGECAAVCVLEDLESALERGAPIYAEVLGFAISNDAYHQTTPDPEGGGAERAMRGALEDAGLTPADVDYINAHGTGTTYNDDMEIRAIRNVFGDRIPPVSSSKSIFGHTLGAAGAIECIVTTLCLAHGFVAPTLRWERPPVEDVEIDFVPGRSREADLRVAISNSFAFGGNTASLVLGRYGG
ncbi:beta-ketoacyl-[acyl-carrier-protein] synthase family protein [Symbiobacterium terraclitae]|uniref:beta-ketoacyl-[acyl-carrier-protein] synthase family protein n=1 Tax=Symbiobacterium terraclitae TaxID=557451 RepID=UPI0035B51421